ncbi:hypothetical protein O3P69_007226 [Scylla paramamosain]|uniref:Gag-like protein n=1 Tax=Scylla paramamosain TaxID=85552 RepID=A0AAW0V302_SCYPA
MVVSRLLEQYEPLKMYFRDSCHDKSNFLGLSSRCSPSAESITLSQSAAGRPAPLSAPRGSLGSQILRSQDLLSCSKAQPFSSLGGHISRLSASRSAPLLGASLSANQRPAAPPHSQPRAAHSAARLRSGRNYQRPLPRPTLGPEGLTRQPGSTAAVQCPGAVFPQCVSSPTLPKIYLIQCPGSTLLQCPGFTQFPGFTPYSVHDLPLHSAQDLPLHSAQDLPLHSAQDLTLNGNPQRDIGVRRQLLAILAPAVKITRLILANDTVMVLTPTDKDADAIFQNGIPSRLATKGFTPVVPPELRAQRTVICTGLDDLIYEHSPEEIVAEVGAQHNWAVAESVFKFPRSTTIKITFKDGDMARKAISEGIPDPRPGAPDEAGDLHPPPDLQQVQRGGGSPHQELSPTTGLRALDCKASTKKCFNCGEEHSARAMRCPNRKEALKRKEVAAQQAQAMQNNNTYAQAA